MKGTLSRRVWPLVLLLLYGAVAFAGEAVDAGSLAARTDGGEAWARHERGIRCVEGSGVPRDDAQAVPWFRLAAAQGHVEGQYNLSVMYPNWQGVRQDDVETLQWARLAAEHGHPGAQYGFGLLYVVGAGVEQDRVAAYLWFTLAAAGLQGQDREMAEYDREWVASKMTPLQIAEAEQRVRHWRDKLGVVEQLKSRQSERAYIRSGGVDARTTDPCEAKSWRRGETAKRGGHWSPRSRLWRCREQTAEPIREEVCWAWFAGRPRCLSSREILVGFTDSHGAGGEMPLAG